MRRIPFIMAGVAAVALCGAAAVAAESNTRPHVLSVQLPNGVTEQIHYAGKIPPQVEVKASADPLQVLDIAPAFWSFQPSFAGFDRLSAEMDRQMAALATDVDGALSQASTAPQVSQAALANAPAGAESYSVISTFAGGHACTRSVQMTSEGPGKAPRVVSKTSGDCSAQGIAPGAPAESNRSQT